MSIPPLLRSRPPLSSTVPRARLTPKIPRETEPFRAWAKTRSGLPSRWHPVPPPRCPIPPQIDGRAITAPAPQSRRTAAQTLALAVASGGGSGYLPVAPGTWGSAVGALLFWPLAALPVWLYALTTAAITALGIWAADEAERLYARKDDGRIVIDEIAGQLVTLSPLLLLGKSHAWPWVVTGFVAFRVFDIWKPGPVRAAERGFRGGAGVVLDDVVAGVLAAAVLAAGVVVVGVLAE
ncbi:MAG: phosphatidylglycerophosphatase A [Myxococcota bacterium]|nr:phosphatidylglycerophosphatase A [Myxococcota bacterium]